MHDGLQAQVRVGLPGEGSSGRERISLLRAFRAHGRADVEGGRGGDGRCRVGCRARAVGGAAAGEGRAERREEQDDGDQAQGQRDRA